VTHFLEVSGEKVIDCGRRIQYAEKLVQVLSIAFINKDVQYIWNLATYNFAAHVRKPSRENKESLLSKTSGRT
jgi:hypothetical protein